MDSSRQLISIYTIYFIISIYLINVQIFDGTETIIYHRSFVRASIIASCKQTEFYVEEKKEQGD